MTGRRKIAGFVICVAAIWGAVVLWQGYKHRVNERKLAEAARADRVRAERGDAQAQYELGVSYASGRGVARDYGEAARWYRKAADQGYARAQSNLGSMYYYGKGVARGLRRGCAVGAQ